jgi:hypothetical protein
MSEHVKGPETGRKYEDSSVPVKHLFVFALGVVALVVAGVLVSAVTFRFFVHHTPMGPAASPFEDVRELPPGLRLQTNAPMDLKKYRDEQAKILSGYGWVDQQAGIVRIPIDRAMELLLQKGYPVRESGQAEGSSARSAKKPTSTATHQVGSTSVSTEGKHS